MVLAFLVWMEKTGGMQGRSDPNVELLDAAALVGHLVPAGSVYAFLAEHRQRLFPDELFADLFPSRRGRPSQPADVVATVLVLQSLEGLSDRDALQALATDLRWKVAAGLAITDPGFHPTVLTLWRNKLRASERPERIFDAVRDVVAETNVLANKTRRALDSTLLDDAVATQDTVTQLVSMIRRTRTAIPAASAVELVGDRPRCGGGPQIDVVPRLVRRQHPHVTASGLRERGRRGRARRAPRPTLSRRPERHPHRRAHHGRARR